MADTHTRERLAVLEAVQDDPSLRAAHLAMAFAISRRINRKTGDAWPKQETLAKDVKVLPRQARNLIRDLERAGYLGVKSGGFQKPDRYRLTLPERQPIATLRAATDCHTERTPERQSSDRQTGNGLPPNPSKEPIERKVGKNTPTPHSLERAFEQWWSLYPWQTEEAAARRLFHGILERSEATIDELIEGVSRYRTCGAVMRGKPKNPKTWLNGACWRDGPEPAPNTIFHHQSGQGQGALTFVKELLNGE